MRRKVRCVLIAWGTDRSLHKVTMNSTSTSIRKNLEKAIRRLHYATAKRTLWINAFYIDQNNIIERPPQVDLMTEI